METLIKDFVLGVGKYIDLLPNIDKKKIITKHTELKAIRYDIKTIESKYKSLEKFMQLCKKLFNYIESINSELLSAASYASEYDLSMERKQYMILQSKHWALKTLIRKSYKKDFDLIKDDYDTDTLSRSLDKLSSFMTIDLIKHIVKTTDFDQFGRNDILEDMKDDIIIKNKIPSKNELFYSIFDLIPYKVNLVEFFSNYNFVFECTESFFQKISKEFNVTLVLYNLTNHTQVIYDHTTLGNNVQILDSENLINFETIKPIVNESKLKEEFYIFGDYIDTLYIKLVTSFGDGYIMTNSYRNNINMTSLRFQDTTTGDRVENYNNILEKEIVNSILTLNKPFVPHQVDIKLNNIKFRLTNSLIKSEKDFFLETKHIVRELFEMEIDEYIHLYKGYYDSYQMLKKEIKDPEELVNRLIPDNMNIFSDIKINLYEESDF